MLKKQNDKLISKLKGMESTLKDLQYSNNSKEFQQQNDLQKNEIQITHFFTCRHADRASFKQRVLQLIPEESEFHRTCRLDKGTFEQLRSDFKPSWKL